MLGHSVFSYASQIVYAGLCLSVTTGVKKQCGLLQIVELFLSLVALWKLIETYVPGCYLECRNSVVNLRNAIYGGMCLFLLVKKQMFDQVYVFGCKDFSSDCLTSFWYVRPSRSKNKN